MLENINQRWQLSLQKAFPYLLLVPAFSIAGIVLAYPLINGIVLSFTPYTFLMPSYEWIGLENYISIIQDPIYWEVFLNSIFIIFASVFIQAAFGLIMAITLNSKIPLRGVFRGAVFVIWIIPMIVISLLAMIIFNTEYGILNFTLKSIGILDKNLAWLGREWASKFALIFTYGWRGIPFFMVMILAALQTIPKDIIEAAEIDGANRFKRFIIITFPYIRHILILSCLLSVVRLFQDITLIFILTKGGPLYATTTLAVHVYKEAFEKFQMGRAAAIGVTWLIFLLFLSRFYIKMVMKDEFRK